MSQYDYKPFNEVDNFSCHQEIHNMRHFYRKLGIPNEDIHEIVDPSFDNLEEQMQKIWEKVAERSEYSKVMIYYYQNGISVSARGGASLVLNHPDLTMFPITSYI